MRWIQQARKGAHVSTQTKQSVGCTTIPACVVSTILTAGLLTGLVFFMRHKGLSNRVIIPIAIGTGLTAQVATCVGGMFGLSPIGRGMLKKSEPALHRLTDSLTKDFNRLEELGVDHDRVSSLVIGRLALRTCDAGLSLFGSIAIGAGLATGVALLMRRFGLTNRAIVPTAIGTGLATNLALGTLCCFGLTKGTDALIDAIARRMANREVKMPIGVEQETWDQLDDNLRGYVVWAASIDLSVPGDAPTREYETRIDEWQALPEIQRFALKTLQEQSTAEGEY